MKLMDISFQKMMNFSEYANPNRLKIVSNFSGSAGMALILKDKNYLFVDGRYTLQAKVRE